MEKMTRARTVREKRARKQEKRQAAAAARQAEGAPAAGNADGETPPVSE